MTQRHETQAVRAALGSEMHFAASSSDALADDTRKRFDDPPRILRTHWDDDVPAPFQPVGGIAAAICNRIARQTRHPVPFPESSR